ncbi:MAG: aromatic-ring-hydroxylating dioxygenase subunit beta [Burkholderiales bacterium]|nr:aromatic-ring-hydroxylating dioxygenase subunit beta [Burkholderiales bacterium]
MNSYTEHDLIAFVYAEARLLDEQRFDAWLELFADEGHYWMPLTPGQTDYRLESSLMYEDKLLLRVRAERLAGARTFSQQPRSRCHHLLQAPAVESMDAAAGRYVVRTAFHYVETRMDAQTLFAGWVTHELTAAGGPLRILLKRVDLVNCDAAFGNINLFM